jgi:hypothetical protein
VVNVSVLVAIGVSKDGYREVLGAMEGAREDKASWRAFLLHLKERGLTSPLLFIADKHLGFIEAFGEIFPETSWQRCMVHFYRNIFSIVPNGKVREVVAMLKAIHAQEDIHAARAKAKLVVARLREMKLPEAAAFLSGANFAWRLRPLAQNRFSLRAAGAGSGGYSTPLRPHPRTSRMPPSQATSGWANVERHGPRKMARLAIKKGYFWGREKNGFN